MPRNQNVKISDLIRDDQLRYRVPGTTAAAVERYTDAMNEYEGWGEFPPLTVLRLSEPHRWWVTIPNDRAAVYAEPGTVNPKEEQREYPAGSLILVGGFTRCKAADRAQVKEAPACVFDGTWEEANRLAWLENTRHGEPRSPGDVSLILTAVYARPDLRALPQSQIAKMAGCSQAYVSKWSAKNIPQPTPPTIKPPCYNRLSDGGTNDVGTEAGTTDELPLVSPDPTEKVQKTLAFPKEKPACEKKAGKKKAGKKKAGKKKTAGSAPVSMADAYQQLVPPAQGLVVMLQRSLKQRAGAADGLKDAEERLLELIDRCRKIRAALADPDADAA